LELKSLGKFIVAFTDLRDTQRALEKVQLTHPEWRAIPVLARECAQESKGTIGGISDFEGQISISVIIHGRHDMDVNSLVHGLVKGFGALVSFKIPFLQADNIKKFFAEFCDTTDAANAVAVLNGAIIEVSHKIHFLLSFTYIDIRLTFIFFLHRTLTLRPSTFVQTLSLPLAACYNNS
jgi:hypothetical protein